MAKVRLQASPATYENGLVTIEYPHTPILVEDVEVKNTAELENRVRDLRTRIDQSAKIFCIPVGRKLRGLDTFKAQNISLFHIKDSDLPTPSGE